MVRFVGVVVMLSSVHASADPRYELGVSMSLEHLSHGLCNDQFVGPCPGAFGYSLQLEAAELFAVNGSLSVVARQSVGGGFSERGTLARAYLGVGARLSWSRWHVELGGGGEAMFGDTGTGESGLASGASLAISPRVGVRVGSVVFEIVGMIAPQAAGHLGLPDGDIGLLASRAFGD